MGRTLYISQTNKPVIKRDGPSIWITEEGRAGRRIPARLLQRVIIIGNVKLDSGTITLFADNNIPITFMNNRTEESAVVIPYNHRLPDHYREQRVFLASEGTINHYKRWAFAKRSLLQLNMLKCFIPERAAKLELAGFGEGNYQEILKSLLKVNERKWLVVNAMVTGILRNLITETLIFTGLDPHTGIIHRRQNFGLSLDLCHIMGGESDMQTLQFFRSSNIKELISNERGNWVVTGKGIRNIAHRFENKSSDVKEKLDAVIDELFNLMREMLS